MQSGASPCSRRRLLRLAVVGPLGALALSACGGTGQTAITSTGSATSATASATSTAAAVPTSSAAASAAATTRATSAVASTSSTVAQAAGAKPTATPAAGNSRQGSPTTVDFWFNWAGTTDIQTMTQLAKQMGETLPFNVHWLAGNNSKLLTAIASGSPPDLAAGGLPYQELWARGAATQLDDLLAKSKQIDKSDIPAGAWHSASFKGKTYGVPAIEAFARFGLVLDMTNLQKYGIDPRTLSWDWDTVTQLQQQYTKTASDGSITELGIDPLSDEGGNFRDGFYFGSAWNVTYFDETTNKYNFANDALADALATVKKLYDVAGGQAKIAAFRKQHGQWNATATAAMPAGVEDMVITGYFAPGQLKHTAPNREFAATWAPVPTAHKGFKAQVIGSHNLLIPQGAKHVAEGFALTEFMVGDTACQALFDGEGFLGARLSFLKKIDAAKYPGLDFFIASATQSDHLGGIIVDPILSYSAQQWGAAMTDVIAGKTQPQAALQQLQQQVTAEYQRSFPQG
jgi:ABC-type glycerol-3-phosphate transport system substrate-binding protein